MFESCANCNHKIAFGGVKEGNILFCSTACRGFHKNKGFCASCLESTNDQGAGSTYTLNGIGTRLYGGKDLCSACNAVTQTKFFCVIFIPLIPLGKYRVLACAPQRYLSRKLKPTDPKNVYAR